MKINEMQNLTSDWFESLRDKICNEFENIEKEYLSSKNKSQIIFLDPQKFIRKKWKRDSISNSDGGGGEMSIMKGNVFEKVGVNISTVFGKLSPEFRSKLPFTEDSDDFFATGISIVAHMTSPLVPAIHMNTRFINTQKHWFGGGSDLNPIFENLKDTFDFHLAFKNICDEYDLDLKKEFGDKALQNLYSGGSYEKFKQECDNYFFIKHRNVSRGVGGIFYDYLNNKNFDIDFKFTKNVGSAFLKIYPEIVRRNMFLAWNDEHREEQLRKRGLYTEFNLLYDRGTKFGLMTGGNVDAILMSLPPIAKWN